MPTSRRRRSVACGEAGETHGVAGNRLLAHSHRRRTPATLSVPLVEEPQLALVLLRPRERRGAQAEQAQRANSGLRAIQ